MICLISYGRSKLRDRKGGREESGKGSVRENGVFRWAATVKLSTGGTDDPEGLRPHRTILRTNSQPGFSNISLRVFEGNNISRGGIMTFNT